MVHDTNLSPGEKLGLLKNNLKGKPGNIVYGLGGGENAYREALRRLRETCGRRDLLRAAQLQAIDKLDPGKGNPSFFKRYAERVRTHLFDLTQIGEGYSTDIIERVGIKLKFADRLVWNEGKRDGYKDRSLEKFGTWLCARTDAYINVYEEAAEQLTGQTQETSHQRHGKVNQISSDSKKSLVCYKCKGPHRLRNCQEFLDLEIADRLKTINTLKLCICCFGANHEVDKCYFTRECETNGCRLNHNPLLHQEENITFTSYAAIGKKEVSLGALSVTARDRQGNPVKVTLMLDEGCGVLYSR